MLEDYVTERSHGLYLELEETDDEEARIVLIEQIAIFDEINIEITRINSLE